MMLLFQARKSSFVIACLFAGALFSASPEKAYRLAEDFERFGQYTKALEVYAEALNGTDRRWGRRAAFRMARLIRNQHFRAGRGERIRRQIIALYKSLLLELPNQGSADPELWAEIHKELPWTRLGLEAPKIYI